MLNNREFASIESFSKPIPQPSQFLRPPVELLDSRALISAKDQVVSVSSRLRRISASARDTADGLYVVIRYDRTVEFEENPQSESTTPCHQWPRREPAACSC